MQLGTAKGHLEKLLKARKPALLIGSPGVGKTSIVKEATDALGYDLIITQPVLDQSIDHKGLPGFVEGNAEFKPFGFLRDIVETKRPTVVFFDDLGHAQRDVQGAIMQYMLARQLNGYRISDSVSFCAATNRKQDKAGVSGLISPLLDRMILLDVKFDEDSWAAWMLARGYDAKIVGFNRFKPRYIMEATPSGDMERIPTPRAMQDIGDLMLLGIRDVDVFAGCAGRAFAAEFHSYLKVVEEMPDPKDVLRRPTKCSVPESPDILFSLMAGLAGVTKVEDVPNLMKFLNRLPEIRYSVVCIKDLLNSKERLGEEQLALCQTPELQSFIKNNPNVFRLS